MSDVQTIFTLDPISELPNGDVTYKLNMSNEVRDRMSEIGVTMLLHCAAAGVDLQEVYGWLGAKIGRANDKKVSKNQHSTKRAAK
jgi:hypothetical protein